MVGLIHLSYRNSGAIVHVALCGEDNLLINRLKKETLFRQTGATMATAAFPVMWLKCTFFILRAIKYM